VLQQGAKTLAAGGWYTMPQLTVDGALFVGDSASMLNVQRLKGIHTAMKSGMLAAETILAAVGKGDVSAATLGNTAPRWTAAGSKTSFIRPAISGKPFPKGHRQIHYFRRPVHHRRPGIHRPDADP